MGKEPSDTLNEIKLLEKLDIARQKINILEKMVEGRTKELFLLNRELESRNKELEQFVFLASHDLQEPLRTISNFAGLIEKQYFEKPDQTARQYFDFILSAASRMQELIKDLLDYSKVSKGTTFTYVDCNTILKQVIAEMGASIIISKAKITFASLPVLKGNENGLKQVFQNLIGNAIKFRRKDTIPEIEIMVQEKVNEYVFSVKDNGIGIEARDIKKMFIIFQRLNNATEYPGTGIGLAICKKIVEQHRGEIWVESELGVGSTFYFTISKEI